MKFWQAVINGATITLEPYDDATMFANVLYAKRPVSRFLPYVASGGDSINNRLDAILYQVLQGDGDKWLPFHGIGNGFPPVLFSAIQQCGLEFKISKKDFAVRIEMKGREEIESLISIPRIQYSLFDLVDYEIKKCCGYCG